MTESNCSLCGQPLTCFGDADDICVCTTCLAFKSAVHPSFLDVLGRPAFFVSRDHTVVRSNTAIREAFPRLDDMGTGVRIGEALDCAHVSEEDRCGETAHCPHCGLNRLIGLVHGSGERLRRIPVHHQRKSGARQTLEFTAAKAGEFVLLLL